MATNTRMAEIKERMARDALKKTGPLGNILPNISKGSVIPIISSSFRVEQIFQELAVGEESTIIQQLIAQWAQQIDYPMEDSYNLARVAQYYMVQQNDDPNARTEIVNFFKMLLVSLASTNPEDHDLAESLFSQLQELRFSDIVKKLEYPKFPSSNEDSLRILARFPLPIYITTSQSNFIERALEAEEKIPHTQICFWSGDITNLSEEHRIDPNYIPSVTHPLVYHLYGLEDYPQTLVLSEDDYINFLISVMEDTNVLNPKVPLNIRSALGESQLLLIGYRLSDWDFRVLFRFIMKFRTDGFSPRGMVIQLKQSEKDFSNEKTVSYLNRYFGKKTFDIEWNDEEVFIEKLWNEWDAYRKNQSQRQGQP